MLSVTEFVCPFCGHGGKRSKEHVWAKWMHSSPGAKSLIQHGTGRRIARPKIRVIKDAEGRFGLDDSTTVRVAELLPHVQVDVCVSCNGGWMSRLEDRVKALLVPWTRAGFPVRLDADAQKLLATWATKSWMAYALTFGAIKNPFLESEYRSIAAGGDPLERAEVWLLSSDSPRAQVSMALHSSLMSFNGNHPDLERDADNYGFAYIAYSGLVLFMTFAPHEKREILQVMRPPGHNSPEVARIWPTSSTSVFPGKTASDEMLNGWLAAPGNFDQIMGMPVVGLTEAQTEEAREMFAAGASVFQIRARYEPTQLGRFAESLEALNPNGERGGVSSAITLGAIAWHQGDYDLAVTYYERAKKRGASRERVGSQLCDALMWAGRYEDALAEAQAVMASGPNEWRDTFRLAILETIVLTFKVRKQRRRPPKLKLLTFPWLLQHRDALHPYLWWRLSQSRRRSGPAVLLGAAFLTDSPIPWLAIAEHAVHAGDSELEAVVSQGLSKQLKTLAEASQLLDALEANGFHSDARAVVDKANRLATTA